MIMGQIWKGSTISMVLMAYGILIGNRANLQQAVAGPSRKGPFGNSGGKWKTLTSTNMPGTVIVIDIVRVIDIV